MATPHVSGAAALLFSLKPGASVEEVSDALLSSADPDSSLAGKTVSGGRLDAPKALAWLKPPAPVLTGTNPVSPAEDANPRIIGTTAAGSRVLLFESDECKGFAAAMGSAAELASPGLQVHVPDESTAEFTAIVETHFNSSPCSEPISYTNSTGVKDETAPNPPVLSSTDPVSPAADEHPKLLGSAEAGATMRVYLGPKCAGTPVAEGSAEELATPGIAVSVASSSTTDFTATATDAAENTSACSDPISYTQVPVEGPDEVPPAAPVLLGTNPVSPASSSNPSVLGSAEAGSTVKVFAGVACGGKQLGQGQAGQLGEFNIQVQILAETTLQLSASSTDAAGNTSGCSNSISYTNTATIGGGTVVAFLPTTPVSTSPSVGCTVPKVIGSSLRQAKAALAGAGCHAAGIHRPPAKKGHRLPALVVKRSTPTAGEEAGNGLVSLFLGPKPHRHHH
jgi:hypothetical protein